MSYEYDKMVFTVNGNVNDAKYFKKYLSTFVIDFDSTVAPKNSEEVACIFQDFSFDFHFSVCLTVTELTFSFKIYNHHVPCFEKKG